MCLSRLLPALHHSRRAAQVKYRAVGDRAALQMSRMTREMFWTAGLTWPCPSMEIWATSTPLINGSSISIRTSSGQYKGRRTNQMRSFGWAMALLMGGYTAYLVVRSVPDIIRYVKLSNK